jgi:hypothetical protein
MRDNIFHELGYWLLYSLLLALAQLWLIPLAYYLYDKPLALVDVIGNGSLLFFATTTASKTAGEYFKKVKTHHPTAKLFCIGLLLLIILPSVYAYALEIATRVGGAGSLAMSPDKVMRLSLGLAVTGIIFSLSFTLITRAYGE